MFNFFKKKGGKDAGAPDDSREHTNEVNRKAESVESRARNDDVTNEPHTTKHVVNLLIPETQYNQKPEKTGVGAILQMMAGKRKKVKRKTARAESVRVSPPKETKNVSLQRSKSEREVKCTDAPTPAKNTPDDPAEFVKSLVLQKYAKPHVSLVYVNDDIEPEKRHAEALLREIARSIDCTIDKINESKQMGGTDSKHDKKEPVYESINERQAPNPIDNYKTNLKGELDKLLEENKEKEEKVDTQSIESPSIIKKSNLKPPRSDTEGCSDDDRSDCGKKKVTFQKHIVFDDGDEQTDEEVDSSFESLTSGEEEEYLEDSLPDNEEFGGFVTKENRTVINVSENDSENDGLRRISSDNSDSGFVDERHDDFSGVKTESESENESESEVSESESESEEGVVIEEISVEEDFDPDDPNYVDNQKSLVTQESKFQNQVSALTELADSRCGETERVRDLIAAYRKEIESKDLEIEQLKCELAKAYKECELVRQRSRSIEEELGAARNCCADLADQLKKRNDDTVRQLRAELEDVLSHRAELESRVQALERDCERLQREKSLQEQRAQEALTAAEANTAKWRSAHEAARSQAAARAERMLADCEWKMRELEQKARDADKQKKELTATIEKLQSSPQQASATHMAELQQLRGVVTEQQRSVQALSLQLQKVETREEALKLEVHRLKELLEKEIRIGKEKEERHMKTVDRLEQQHSKAIETLKSELTANAASARAALERTHAERSRAALGQLRAEADQHARNADRRLREVTTKFENLKEVLAAKERQFETALQEAHSKADWDIMQLRHMLDKSDISHANTVEKLTENYEQEKERINEEWESKIRSIEEQAATAAEDARKTLETTRQKLIAERIDQVNKLKEQHRQEMDDQWERFMSDKETCLQRMKAECRQEGEEERVQREKELLEQIEELKAQLASSTVDYDQLADKAAACGRTLAVTEQELREALAREKDLREKRSDDATKMKQIERSSKNQVEHLTRKCACLRKLFDDMRARLTAREQAAVQESHAKEKEIHKLRAEVARLTKMLVQDSSPKLGARTSADGCETDIVEESDQRRKGFHRSSLNARKRPTMPDITLTPEYGRQRSKSVDLPAIPVPERVKQLEEISKSRENLIERK